MKTFLRWGVIVVVSVSVLISLFYAEENWRGKRAWENYKRELEAKGEILDWNKFIPPPVPDDKNFFKAPKMAEWFVKTNGQITNELTARLHEPHTTSVTIGEIVVLPPSTNASMENADIALRYSSFGKAVFLSAPIETNMSSPNFLIPLIQFEDVPITTAIENLARQASISYSLDPKIGYGQPDENGEIKPEPVMSLRWENITARQALLAVLNKFDLQLMDEPNIGGTLITMKAPGAPELYAASDVGEKITQLFQNAIGANAIGAQGFALLVKPLHQIKPVRIVLHSEKMPDEKEIAAFGPEFFSGNLAKLKSSFMRVEPPGTNSFQIVANSVSAADYLKWSGQFEADFDLIRKALKRPYARMGGGYESFYSTPVPNYVTMRAVAQALAQRAQCHLLLGQPENALRELTLLHDVCRLLEARPTGKPMTLVAALINAAVVGLYADTIADGMRLKVWREPQLAALQKQLEEINLSPFVFGAFRVERAGICSFLENRLSGKPGPWQFEKRRGESVTPRGWLYQNLVNLSVLEQKMIDSYNPVRDIVLPDSMNNYERELAAIENHFGPYTYFIAVGVPNYSKAMHTAAYYQTMANETQIVCALERYYLAHGDYPETLDALMPQFMEKIPHDIIGGQPLHYRRTEDGKFLLYSVGWNETDDDGLPGTLTDVKTGDWVWQSPLN